MIGMCWYYL